MRAALALIPSGLLLLVGGFLWGWGGDHPTLHPGDLPHRSPRALRPTAPTPRTPGQLNTQSPPVAEGRSAGGAPKAEFNLSAPGLGPPRTDSSSPLEQGIFWPRVVERALPRAFPEEDAWNWQDCARNARIVSLERGCGRSTNRLATLSDGSRVCVRYGINSEQILGEVLSFYLSRMLGVRGVPPCVLSRVDSPQWAPVRAELGSTGWAPGSIVTLTPWVQNLSAVLPPPALRAEDGHLRPLRGELNSNLEDLVELAQWGDLIVFDYLTANFDRLVSNMFSLQWDPRVMLRGTNNLHRTPDGTLVLLDNEAGLVHGYRLRDTWDKYNQQLLDTVCMFRRGVTRKLMELNAEQSAAKELHALYLRSEPLAEELGLLSEPEAQILQERVGLVYSHTLSCQDRYR
ncbi:four-jointed box protein 1 [Spea bombifrons]|uniref:four-jointed box protein 1 n=1 Tax=Spea bombifrons TaxID=233779 RepID=UPI00234BA72E|nr:four-jointed box protein 1 [Spea bombifrons]